MDHRWLKFQCPDCAVPIPQEQDEERKCPSCKRLFEERDGIFYALPTAVENARVKEREKEGWQRLLGHWDDAQRSLLLNLPFAEGTELDSIHYRQAAREFSFAREYLSPIEGKRGLDLGGQTGWAAYRFAQLDAEMVCVDYNECAKAGLRAGDVYLQKGIHFDRICADAESLPLAENQFDFVYSSAFLHHLPNPGVAVRHVSRVLKPGGVYFATLEAFCPFWMTRRRALRRCDMAQEFISQGINEQVFYMREYERWFREAGLSLEVVNPRWDRVEKGRVIPNWLVGRNGYLPEILENRRESAGLIGIAARIVLRSEFWRLFSGPGSFGLLRRRLLSGTQKFRILIGHKKQV